MTELLELQCERTPTEAKPSARVARVARQFGISRDGEATGLLDPLRIHLGPGQIIALVGPSGSGKTTALQQIEHAKPAAHTVHRIAFPPDRAVIDAVMPGAKLSDALSVLSACGLGEARLWIRYFAELSEGERFRARLARAVGAQWQGGKRDPLLCDEFCTGLHRRAARAIAYNLRKLATNQQLCFVIAASIEDVLGDLQPDVIIRIDRGRAVETIEQTPRRKRFSLARRVHIDRGSRRDYNTFAAMHYRAADELGFVDKVFAMRDGVDGELLGVIVYSHPALELALRNQATDKWFSRNPARVNRELRIVRRLVIHPDVRGCGLGQRLVRVTLPRVGTRFVECLASMGEVNPVFERAGMRRIGQYPPSPQAEAAVQALRKLDVDPTARDFVLKVCRQPRVRRIVANAVVDWYRATTSGGESRVARQSPQLLANTFRGLIGNGPVYYLWERKNP